MSPTHNLSMWGGVFSLINLFDISIVSINEIICLGSSTALNTSELKLSKHFLFVHRSSLDSVFAVWSSNQLLLILVSYAFCEIGDLEG